MQYTSLGPFLKVLIEKIGRNLKIPMYFFSLKNFVHDFLNSELPLEA